MTEKNQPDLARANGRLKAARIAANYRTAKEFAVKNDINYPTYKAHERGQNTGRGIRENTAKGYASILQKRIPNITSDWILYREGPAPFATDDDDRNMVLNTDLMADCLDVVVTYCIDHGKSLSGERIALVALCLYQAYEFETGGLKSHNPAIPLYIGSVFDD